MPDLESTRAALRAAASACCALFSAAPDGSIVWPGSDWNVAEVAERLDVAVSALLDATVDR